MRAVDGVKDVEIDGMELVVTRDRSKVSLERVIEVVRKAGFDARPK